jgi:hypothetical protein
VWSVGGAGALNGKVPRILSSQFSTSDTLTASVISTTETEFATTFQVPANYIISNRVLVMQIGGQFTSSGSPPTTILRVRMGAVGIGGTIIYQGPTAAYQSGLTSNGVGNALLLIGTGAAGASVNTITTPWFAGSAANVQSRNTVAQPVALATNGALNINVTLQYSANTAGNSMTLLNLIVMEFD